MNYIFNGSRNNVTLDPRHIKALIDEMLRNHSLFKNIYPNTDLGVDLKTYTLNPGRMEQKGAILGAIVRDGEFHYMAVELPIVADILTDMVAEALAAKVAETPDANAEDATVGTETAFEKKGVPVKRTPIVIPGKCVNLHRRDDGTPSLAFCHPALTKSYTWKNYCIEAAQEILSLASLVEEERPTART